MQNNSSEVAFYLSKKQLEDYRSLLKEAADERMRLHFLEKEAQRRFGASSVEAEAYREALKNNVRRCVVAANEVRRFIDSIEESKIRRVFLMYYVDGWSWQKIAFAIGSHCEATPRNMHNRYLAKLYAARTAGKEKTE